MNAGTIFQQLSDSPSTHRWKLESFDDEVNPNIFIEPRLAGNQRPPPYHLTCYLEPSSQYAQTLITASDYQNAAVTTQEIEAIGRDILSRLDEWSDGVDLADILSRVTIGSKFRLDGNNGLTRVWLAPNHELQRRYLPIARLRELWGSDVSDLPPLLDFDDLQSLCRLHNSVSKVLLPNGETAIFKGVVAVVARMYHELRELLRMPPHPNIMPRPNYIVTRRFHTSIEPVVCGFILPYLSGGSLLQRITSQAPERPLTLPLKIKWIRQIISALLHLYGPASSFHSDLRLDNIVLDENEDIILADFEQYSSTPRWVAPFLWLENRTKRPRNPGWLESKTNPAKMPNAIFYSNPRNGYLMAFVGLSERERQGLESYNLAKIMWCLFEGESNALSFLDLSPEELNLRRDDGTALRDAVFPNFRQTPQRLRHWIWLCTKQSPEWGASQCRCTNSEALICGQSGSLLGNNVHEEGDTSRKSPSIHATHRFFEDWVADRSLTSSS